MNTTQRVGILQRWRIVQHELMHELRQEIGPLTPRMENMIHTLEWVLVEEFEESAWSGKGRPPHDRGALSNAFVAKAVLGLGTTAALAELVHEALVKEHLGAELIGHISRDGTAIEARSR